jgi:hypothetical protein
LFLVAIIFVVSGVFLTTTAVVVDILAIVAVNIEITGVRWIDMIVEESLSTAINGI